MYDCGEPSRALKLYRGNLLVVVKVPRCCKSCLDTQNVLSKQISFLWYSMDQKLNPKMEN